ncbi:hypothetical protein [Haloprofundus sp. MHR1]|uniref:hypothetical protein n=1 Tax=Haloprofundus sp. MHR1 TaxID=2572921 RepID=UPI0010BE6AED|nr:hypothetical protein [Haloprofundus sp. MHR1]QCJ47252.1 hypothetical protein FCF25_09045 [Haloprofundus sp. MHR1]
MTHLKTILVALLIVTSMLPAAAVGAAADSVTSVDDSRVAQANGPGNGQGPPSNGPPGHAGVPGDNVRGPPAHAAKNIPSDAGVWDVHASMHADNLEVDIGERGGKVEVVLRDDVNHDGREVAVSASALEAAVGHRPSTAIGVHESGDRWTSEIRYEDGWALFDVEKFSSNTVTFDGSVTLSGNPAEDGSTYRYDLDDIDSTSDPNVTLTGVTSEQWDNESFSAVGDGESVDVDVGGHLKPSGPSVDGEPVVEFEGMETLFAESESGTGASDGSTSSVSVAGDGDPQNAEVTFTGRESSTPNDQSGSGIAGGDTATIDVGGNADPTGPASGSPELTMTGRATEFTEYTTEDSDANYLFNAENAETSYKNHDDSVSALRVDQTSDSSGTVDVYVVTEAPDGAYGEGTHVGTWNYDSSPGVKTFEFDEPVDVSGSEWVTFEFVVQGDARMTTQATYDKADDYGSSGGSLRDRAHNVTGISTPMDISVSDGQGNSASFGDLGDGEQSAKALGLSHDSTGLTFSATGGELDFALDKDDVTATENPSIDVDDDGSTEATYNGVLRDGETGTETFSGLSTGTNTVGWELEAGSTDWRIDYDRVEHTENPSVDLDGDGNADAEHLGTLEPGETARYELAGLSTGASTLDVSTTSQTETNVAVLLEERNPTVDPVVTINNETLSHGGTLADGESVPLAGESSWLTEGENVVEVSVGNESTASSGPSSRTNLEYSHSAASNQSVDYEAEHWAEKYNVSKTWGTDREDATLTVPFSSSRVIQIDQLEVQRNGGEWSTLDSTEYDLEGTTLTVQLGDVAEGDETRVRASGAKVRTVNGDIRVLEPTLVGSDLQTKFEVVDRDDETMHIEVGGTLDGSRTHYLSNQSWSDGTAYTRFEPGQKTELHLPGADIGSTATVETAPLEAEPSNGDVEVVWRDDATNARPKFDVRPGGVTGDKVSFTFTNAVSGDEYDLYSETNGIVYDSATANSPVTLENDDSEETLIIMSEATESSNDGNATGGGFYDSASGTLDRARDSALAIAPVIEPELIALLVLLLIGGAFAYTERENDRSPVHEREEVIGSVVLAFALAVFLIAPTTITRPIETALSAALPLAGVAGVLGGAYLLYSWRQERQAEASTPDQVFRVGGTEVETKDTKDGGGGGWF